MNFPEFLMSPSNDRFVDRLILLTLFVASAAIGLAEEHYYYQAILALCFMVGIWLAAQHPDRAGLAQLYNLQKKLALAATAWMLFEWFLLRADVNTLGHFAMLLAAVLLLRPRSTRDQTVMVVLVLLLVIIGAIVSSSLEFGVALMLFVLLLPFICARLHLQRQLDLTREKQEGMTAHAIAPLFVAKQSPDRRVGVLLPAAKASTAALCAGLVLFFAFPRFGTQVSRWRSGPGPMVTGDTADAELGADGDVQSLQRPVMRVWLEVKGQELGPKDIVPYFRSAALEEYVKFRGGKFRWRHGRRSSIRRDSLPTVEVLEQDLKQSGRDPRAIAWIDQWYDFLTRPPRYLYGVFPVLAFESDDLSLVERSSEDDALVVPTGRRPRDLFYFARSPLRVTDDLAAWLREKADPEDSIAPSDPPNWKPPNHVIPIQIRDEAKRVAGVDADSGDAQQRLQIAGRIRDYLINEPFSYSLELPDSPMGEDPVAYFLTVEQSGHCQYFASAMVLMCQSLGIPARLGVGYLGGDYNDVGKFFLVKESHAHAWAEVFIPGKGWRIFDPTPAIDRDDQGTGLIAWLLQAVQVAQYEWITRVIAFDREQRRRLFDQTVAWLTEDSETRRGPLAAVAHGVEDTWTRLRRASWPAFVGVVMAVIVSLVALAWFFKRAWRWMPRRRAGERFVVRREAAFINDFLARMAERGYRRLPQQTMREFAATVPENMADRQAVAAVVKSYYDAQFSGRALSETRRQEVREALRRLRPNGTGRGGKNGESGHNSLN